MSRVKRCPKCGEELSEGKVETRDINNIEGSVLLTGKELEPFSILIYPFYCKNCGYIEFYTGMKGKRK